MSDMMPSQRHRSIISGTMLLSGVIGLFMKEQEFARNAIMLSVALLLIEIRELLTVQEAKE